MKKPMELIVAVVWMLCLPLGQSFSLLQDVISTTRGRTLLSASSTRNNDDAGMKNAVQENTKILILPGFGNDSKDYYLEEAPQGSLVRSLEKRGWQSLVPDQDGNMYNEQIRVLPVSRLDWLQVFLKGALDVKFWMADAAPTRPAFAWYLERVATAVQEMTSNDDDNDNEQDTKVVLVCHSAGGWLARACLGFWGTNDNNNTTFETTDTRSQEGADADADAVDASSIDTTRNVQIPLDRILGVVTLGAPHLPPPPQVMDMTRGALRITHETFPGAYHKNEQDGDIFYITVAGNAVRGEQQERQSPWEPTTVKGFAYNSYEAVLGEGTALGDGVVPVDAAHLEDAIQIDLDGILHSINAPDQWYGSDAVIDLWHETLLDEMKRARQGQGKKHQQPEQAQTL